MLISCNKLQDKLLNSTNKIELYTVKAHRVCSYYTDIVVIKGKILVEIPVCALDAKYMIPSKPNAKELTFISKDRLIKRTALMLSDRGLKKQGNIYIELKCLYIEQ